MENVSKALLIAAGIFMAILILSLLVVLYSDVSSYYAQKHEAILIEQATKFNAQFENYNKKNIRGNDLISLMNKVINYNATESYFEGTNYKRIKVKISLGEEQILNQFKYDNETYKNEYLISEITNTKGTNDWKDDINLIAITKTSADLCAELKTIGVKNPSDTKLQKLAANISNVIVNEKTTNSTMDVYNRLKRAELIEELLGLKVGSTLSSDIRINEETGITFTDSKSQNTMNSIKEITSQYYQYMQFKRAHFDCISVIYDTETNRVVEMNFKLQTKLVNGVETVVFE